MTPGDSTDANSPTKSYGPALDSDCHDMYTASQESATETKADVSSLADIQFTDKGAENESNGPESRCGWFSWTPSCFQTCHTTKWLLTFMCVMVVIQGAVINGMVSSSLSMLEKRFELTSTHTGVLGASYDIGVLLSLVMVTYVGGQGHKGRWIAGGTVIMGLGSIFFSLPQFTTGLYEYDPMYDSKCVPGRNVTSNCNQQSSNLSYYFWWFLLSQLLHGIGASPMFTLTFVYLDENVKQKNSAVYTSVYYVASIIGPAIGYLTSGQVLKIYGDIGSVDLASIDIDPDDPRWYGAWWLGLVVCGVLALIVAVPLSGYARQLPKSDKYRKERAEEAQTGTITEVSGADFGKSIKDLPLALKNLVTNKTYVFCALSDSMESFIVGAYATFAPKFLENLFNMSASSASTLAGLILIPAAGGGSLLSGILMHKLNMDCKMMLRYCFICLTLSVVVCTSLFLVLGCEKEPYAGVTVDYVTSLPREGLSALTGQCNSMCDCNAEIYKPVCGMDNMMYFSPCHAGCSIVVNASMYGNCSCVEMSNISSSSMAVGGKCAASCTLMPVFLVALFIFVFLTFLVATPQIQIILRCVAYSQRSLATGVGWISARLLGSIPGPIIMGQIIDSSCIAWGKKCDQQTSCLYYDNNIMAWKIGLMTVCVKLLSLFLSLLAWLLYKPEKSSENCPVSENKKIGTELTEKDLDDGYENEADINNKGVQSTEL